MTNALDLQRAILEKELHDIRAESNKLSRELAQLTQRELINFVTLYLMESQEEFKRDLGIDIYDIASFDIEFMEQYNDNTHDDVVSSVAYFDKDQNLIPIEDNGHFELVHELSDMLTWEVIGVDALMNADLGDVKLPVRFSDDD